MTFLRESESFSCLGVTEGGVLGGRLGALELGFVDGVGGIGGPFGAKTEGWPGTRCFDAAAAASASAGN